MTSIAVQLSDSIPTLHQHIYDAVENAKDMATRSLGDQWRQLVLAPMSKLECSDSQSWWALVIDALDECDDNRDIDLIVRLLAETQSMERVRLRVFLTSRPEVPIRNGFDKISNRDHHDLVLHDIAPAIVAHDISIFLDSQLAMIRKEQFLDTAWPGRETISKLVQRAAGLFIWAATACRYIGEVEDFAVERLDQILNNGKDTTITAPEEHLDQLYMTVLEQSVNPKYTDKEKKIVLVTLRLILGSIVALFSPLSVPSLGKLVNITRRRIDLRLTDLHSILDIPEDSIRSVRLHHPSFRDFLLDETRCTNRHFCVGEKQAHQTLAEGCIRLMSESLTQYVCGYDKPGTLVEEVETDINQKLAPEVQYACMYWIQHLQKGEYRLKDNDNVHKFLQRYLLYWLEALGWMGKTAEGLHAIGTLESLATVSFQDHVPVKQRTNESVVV
jgi:hypothetical protein